MNLVEDDPCHCAVTCLDGEYKEENVQMMAWKTVRGSYSDTERVKFRTLPEVAVAGSTCQGRCTRITMLLLRRVFKSITMDVGKNI